MTGRGAVEIEAVLVALDVGTSKVVALVGEVTREGAISIIGKGVVPASGLKKGVVNNIEQTVASIRQAVEAPSGCRACGSRLPSWASVAARSRASIRGAPWPSAVPIGR